MGVSHISDVESIILYLYFQIIIIIKNVCERFPSSTVVQKSMCLSGKK
uniref:Uncharacterized protein n=1 Tax=Anguilla anguilla TaxID=7936 RepID=A0A0E9V4I8_ANGAN